MAEQSLLAAALKEARKSTPKATNYCVGALLVDEASGKILSSGYTLELPGNTHAEQCCLQKYAQAHGVSEDEVSGILPDRAVIYTTMEPCTERLSGNLPCTQRILKAKRIRKVYTGVSEPATFVRDNSAKAQLEAAGIEYIHVPGLEKDILQVATAGHPKK